MHGDDGRAEGKSDVSREGGCPYKPSGSHRSSSEPLPGHGAGVLLWQPHQAGARPRSSAPRHWEATVTRRGAAYKMLTIFTLRKFKEVKVKRIM